LLVDVLVSSAGFSFANFKNYFYFSFYNPHPAMGRVKKRFPALLCQTVATSEGWSREGLGEGFIFY